MPTGIINWGATIRSRVQRGYTDPTIIVVSAPTGTRDTSSARLLKFLLSKVFEMSGEVLDSTAFLEDATEGTQTTKWMAKILSIHNKAKGLLRHALFRDIALPVRVDKLALQRLRSSRDHQFGPIYEALVLYEHLFVSHDLEALRKCLEHGVLRPLSRDTLFEVAVLFATMEAIERAGWHQSELRLIGYGQGASATYRRGYLSLRLHYQSMPRQLAEGSRYASILRRHGLDTGLRRPDILLETREGSRGFRIIEVKRSSERRYLADSIYKVLGYLKDFGTQVELSDNPQAILVVWDGVTPSHLTTNDEMAILTFATYETFMERLQKPNTQA
jgi:hypothetical protein